MVELTCKRVKYLLNDEEDATKEYRYIATHDNNLTKKEKAMFKAMSRDEHRHHQNILKLKPMVCNR
jgi:rubrerythrin